MAADQIAALLMAQAMNPIALLALIIAATFVLEDAATVAVGLAAAAGHVPIELALGGLIAGTILGDIGLHVAGRWIATTRYGRRLRADPRVAKAETWLDRRQVATLAIARLVPGLRLPTYVASGFLKLPFVRTALVLGAMTLVWTPSLFFLSHGAAGFGAAGWLLVAALFGAVLLAPRIVKARLA